MALIVPNAGEEAFLALILAVNMTLRLFTNDVTGGLTPGQVDQLTEADVTEATFPGYVASPIAGGSWSTTPLDPSTGTATQRAFTRSSTGAAELVRGYFLTRDSDGALMWFDQFPAPISVEFLNDQVLVTPRITLDDTGGNVSIPIGGSIMWSGPGAVPAGFLERDGAAVSRSTFADLFAVIGTTYGPGDGATTFNLPDSRQRFHLGLATSGTGAVLGETGGAIDHTHGLDTASSHAKITMSVGGVQNPLLRRRSGVASWTTTQVSDGGGANTAAGQNSGAELGGDSGLANPPYIAERFIIRAL